LKGSYHISTVEELLPTLREAPKNDTVSIIACPVDYSANSALIAYLGKLDESLS
jgi:acetolactate synthase-1/2/3 large subunit